MAVLERTDVPWREREFLTMQQAGAIAGVSTASIYVYARRGEVQLERFAGRTVIRPGELQRLMSAAAVAWVPDARSQRAVEARGARTRRAWTE